MKIVSKKFTGRRRKSIYESSVRGNIEECRNFGYIVTNFRISSTVNQVFQLFLTRHTDIRTYEYNERTFHTIKTIAVRLVERLLSVRELVLIIHKFIFTDSTRARILLRVPLAEGM